MEEHDYCKQVDGRIHGHDCVREYCIWRHRGMPVADYGPAIGSDGTCFSRVGRSIYVSSSPPCCWGRRLDEPGPSGGLQRFPAQDVGGIPAHRQRPCVQPGRWSGAIPPPWGELLVDVKGKPVAVCVYAYADRFPSIPGLRKTVRRMPQGVRRIMYTKGVGPTESPPGHRRFRHGRCLPGASASSAWNDWSSSDTICPSCGLLHTSNSFGFGTYSVTRSV